MSTHVIHRTTLTKDDTKILEEARKLAAIMSVKLDGTTHALALQLITSAIAEVLRSAE